MPKVKKFLPKFHINPFKGWMNDPNGLGCFKESVHIFYQSNPNFPNGNNKGWGHYTTKDFKKYSHHKMAINADSVYDKDGAYSGSSIVKDGKMYLFYTGNVKHEGEYDYILSGREANVLRVESQDGINFGNKTLILTNDDYPENMSCHVRDPKVYFEDGKYHLLLGGRTVDDKAALLEYVSLDFENWVLSMCSKYDDLGYMLECMDYFVLDGKRVYSYCPQGVKEEKNAFKNIFSSGYSIDQIDKALYNEWDLGYDFYAPQTFEDNNARRIIIGWAGIDDKELEYTYPTEQEGWMHCHTLPRQVTYKNGKLYQYPIQEIFELKGEYQNVNYFEGACFMVQAKIEQKAKFVLHDSMVIDVTENAFTVSFLNQAGAGRKQRSYDIKVEKLLIVNDASIVEIYINDGEYVFTSRVFPEKYCIQAECDNVEIAEVKEAIYEEDNCDR